MKLDSVAIGYFKGKNTVEIQKDINCVLEKGEFTCLIGPNGTGKTTLLRSLAGFIPSLNGNICIDGEDIREISSDRLAKTVSVVLTERPSVQSMTVVDLIALGRSPYTGFWGKTDKKDKEYIDQAIKDCNIESLRHRLVDTLSDGERQKVMIAKAIAQSTPIILLDEPTAFLDFPSKADTMRLLARLAHDNNKSILQSTHDLNMALALADKIWLLDKKLGFACGTPRELADNGILEKYFKGDGIIFDHETISFSLS